ncbi:hypothetical protein HPB47_001034 [Ixodes persulcatus]|uniref:Uncharacterized protein n=1 Tax=Ixodes persulcatus TaxID=34615 RepID=A0AC60PQV1_IXOPE|nr:hypothetical protein HPB47_001034 [Ixodes persulcatus]
MAVTTAAALAAKHKRDKFLVDLVRLGVAAPARRDSADVQPVQRRVDGARLRLDAARERSSRARSHSLFLPQSPSQAGQRRPLLLPLNRFDDRDIAKPWRDYAYAHRSAVQISIGVSGPRSTASSRPSEQHDTDGQTPSDGDSTDVDEARLPACAQCASTRKGNVGCLSLSRLAALLSGLHEEMGDSSLGKQRQQQAVPILASHFRRHAGTRTRQTPHASRGVTIIWQAPSFSAHFPEPWRKRRDGPEKAAFDVLFPRPSTWRGCRLPS